MSQGLRGSFFAVVRTGIWESLTSFFLLTDDLFLLSLQPWAVDAALVGGAYAAAAFSYPKPLLSQQEPC